jgi:hypothetical protein
MTPGALGPERVPGMVSAHPERATLPDARNLVLCSGLAYTESEWR